MDITKFKEIMNSDYNYTNRVKCNILTGLHIIDKYCPGKGLESAEHDIVYSVEPYDLIGAGISENDVYCLRNNGWFVDEEYDCLASFV